MGLTWKPTERGDDWRAEFWDADGHACELLVGGDRGAPVLYLGPSVRLMRLTQSQVAEMLPRLRHFAETGRLMEQGAQAPHRL